MVWDPIARSFSRSQVKMLWQLVTTILTCCWWKSLIIYVVLLLLFTQLLHFSVFLFFGFSSIKGISSLASLSVGCDVLLTFYLSAHFLVVFQFYSVLYLGCKYEEILNNYKHIVSEILYNLSYPIWDLGSLWCVVNGPQICIVSLFWMVTSLPPPHLKGFFFFPAYSGSFWGLQVLNYYAWSSQFEFYFFHCLHVNKGYSLWKFWY